MTISKELLDELLCGIENADDLPNSKEFPIGFSSLNVNARSASGLSASFVLSVN